MSANEELLHESDCTYVLVTGANSGLGFAICCRLVDDFITTRPSAQSLRLIVTTRDERKSLSTVTRLTMHLALQPRAAQRRISFQPELLNLTSLQSVHTLAAQLLRSVPKLDAIVLNAGIGGIVGIDWPAAVWSILTNFRAAVTYPTYKRSSIGWTTRPQTSSNPDLGRGTKPPHPPLAEVFCANVFGHYVLAHQLVPLLSAPAPLPLSPGGRLIWISSVEAHATSFSSTDMQGLQARHAYESSKRLTDVLALTARLPTTRPFVTRFLHGRPAAHPDDDDHPPPTSRVPAQTRQDEPSFYLAHPGICATAIVPLPLILQYLMIAATYVARWLGSPWHTVQAYKGACAPVWLALSARDEIDAATDASDASDAGPAREREARQPGQRHQSGTVAAVGGVKWGSSTDRAGRERVRATPVDGAGDEAGEWEELGRSCWMQMEALREEWEGLIGGG